QVGKTTVCRRVVELARGLGYDPAGVLAPALLDEDGFPLAYHALMVSDGQQRLLARANGDLGGPRTGRYSFDADVFSWMIARLRGAISQGCDLLIVDEIGPLELEQGRGLAPILSDLSAEGLPPLLLVVRAELAGRLQKRLPDIPFRTFTVTQDNRQALPDAIIKELFADHDRGR
ncbi:MAG: nucleoside-triphosphatase, partial [Anaerolineae bacterium]